jgi:hypothetical protein
MRLDQKVAIVTGGAGGIGRAIVETFAAAGASVVLAGRDARKLEVLARQVGGVAVVCDVTKQDNVDRLFDAALALSGQVDVLINNAGQSGPVEQLADVDLEAWRACLEVNLFGAMYCLRVAARLMTAQGHGSIVNISSLMGLRGYPMRSAYCAAKFALIGLTEAVAHEVGRAGVRVNALCPGAVRGELMDKVISRRAAAETRSGEQIIRESYTNVAALRRWVDPQEVAKAALFLASDASGATTGSYIKVDAGRL